MIQIIDLKISGEYEQNISIEKDNKLKIINYKTYLDFYKYFYLKQNLFVQNKEVNKKDFIVIDVTNVNGIIKQMEFNKGNIFYEYVINTYNNISLDKKEPFYLEFLKQIDVLKENLDVNFEFVEEDNIDKVIMQNMDININFDNLFQTFLTTLNKVVNENITKTYIIFYDSKILDIKLDSDNYYLFDLNQYLDIDKYNLLISSDVQEFNVNSLVNYIESIWPKGYEEDEIRILLKHYFKYLIYLNEFDTVSIELYILGIILNKTYGLKQKINYTKPINDNIIKSFIDTF